MEPLLKPGWQNSIYSSGWKKTAHSEPVIEPATGAILAQVGSATATDLLEAIKVAKAAQKIWAATSPIRRAEIMEAAVGCYDAARAEIEEWVVREIGSTRGKAKFEFEFAREELVDAAAMPHESPGLLLPDAFNRHSYATRTPMGVVGVITPFNVPLLLAARAVFPALATGNALILKPNAASVVCGGFLIALVMERAGLPPGVLQVIPGATVGEELVSNESVNMIHFTGSTRTGRRIGEAGGKALKRVSLSMSGKNAFIVLDDADVEAAASNGAYGAFFYSGQSCMSPGRHIVHESLVDKYVKRVAELAEKMVLGDPWKSPVDIGPMINLANVERVQSWVAEAVAGGAKIHAGGTHAGQHFRPTVLTGVKPGMKLYEEETFGPVAIVYPFATDDEAAAIANDTLYGLAAAVQTRNLGRGRALTERLQFGNVHVNDPTVMDYSYVPWGGFNYAGNGGRYGKYANWEEYTQWKWTTLRDVAVPNHFTDGN